MYKKKNTYKVRLLWIGALILLVIIIKILASYPVWIETAYVTKFYFLLSATLRFLFGWLPFSLGDILYLAAAVWAIKMVWKSSARLLKRQLNKQWFINAGYKLLVIALSIYIIFNLFWGLNYNRQGSETQLDLKVEKIDSLWLKEIDSILLLKVNKAKQIVVNQQLAYQSKAQLFSKAMLCYKQAKEKYPFINYENGSVKSSMFGWLGNYLGFTGYYNPFTGEAQLNTTVPKFIMPYTTLHEMAHQLGYAKEEEANFVGYLVAVSSTDTLFQYSAYLDLFMYANRKLFFTDSVYASSLAKQLSPQVKADLKELHEFLLKHKSPIEPMIRWAYGSFLKANQQPKGITSYDEVIADLIAYYKKYGKI